MDSLLTILVALDPPSDAGARRPVGQDRQLYAWASRVGADGAAPAALWTAVLTWSRLHGVISLEIGGNFGSMGIDAARLYEAEIDDLLKVS